MTFASAPFQPLAVVIIKLLIHFDGSLCEEQQRNSRRILPVVHGAFRDTAPRATYYWIKHWQFRGLHMMVRISSELIAAVMVPYMALPVICRIGTYGSKSWPSSVLHTGLGKPTFLTASRASMSPRFLAGSSPPTARSRTRPARSRRCPRASGPRLRPGSGPTSPATGPQSARRRPAS